MLLQVGKFKFRRIKDEQYRQQKYNLRRLMLGIPCNDGNALYAIMYCKG